jgi:hypothetical protein
MAIGDLRVNGSEFVKEPVKQGIITQLLVWLFSIKWHHFFLLVALTGTAILITAVIGGST